MKNGFNFQLLIAILFSHYKNILNKIIIIINGFIFP